MKVAIDISPLQSGHKVRGVGFYLHYLKASFLKYFPEHDYTFFTDTKEIPADVDLVHYPYFDPFFLTLPLVKKHKTVVTVHDLTPLVFPEHFPAGIKGTLRWQLQKMLLRQVDGVIGDSEASRKDIIKIAGVDKEKVFSVYLAAGEEFKKMENGKWKMEILKKYNLPKKFVLYVGDVTWNKNLPNLVRAVQQADLPLVMVGKSLATETFDHTNPWNANLVEFHELIKNDKRIIRLGFIPTEDVVALYNSATVFAFPSLYEGFGLPVIEAMQSGCPVVTTKGGSLAAVAGDAAFFVDGYDVNSIADGMNKVFSDKHMQQDLIAKGLKQASTFSWQKTASETIQVYQNVLQS
ncbi:MAG: glycosyltransferase family 1 protein [Patescibacteria group bacterium]